ncbi:hypothetical protein RIF29_17032 [Crotalaria pallida]|uniref:Uncharacterized protein n=1 Tax=Crotalaria pallida TaxID=3830 RepID=A0AAN9IK81_CROPI
MFLGWECMMVMVDGDALPLLHEREMENEEDDGVGFLELYEDSEVHFRLYKSHCFFIITLVVFHLFSAGINKNIPQLGFLALAASAFLIFRSMLGLPSYSSSR